MSEVTSNSNNNETTFDENQTDICVVCFKNVEIYSIGECDHPVCYDCSTRMRVLCQQNECPICRKSLSKVIFTNKILKYRELEATRSEYYNKKYKIAFENSKIQNAFYTLLNHPCPMCEGPPFHSFEALKNHVRKEHEHFYCDICIEHLKIFTFERRCYNRHDLAMHRRKGDVDNTSHRGHPLCQYCECRFLDRDELFRHLRKEHYFCHFCDADGSNEFYADYESLREHFRNEHYLCEEGDCVREQFTAVFRSDIDLKAHFASVHGKSLNKQQAKHARTLQLEIRLGHRGRPSHSKQDNQPGANLHIRRPDSNENCENQQFIQPRQIPIAPLNEEEFPSLGGTSANSAISSLMRPNMSNIRKSGPGGLARTKENFPALGPPTADSVPKSNNNLTPASAIVKGGIKSSQNKADINGMVIHVSNRPSSSVSKNLTNLKNFPALPSHSKQFPNKSDNEDMVCSPEINNLSAMISAKHRQLVDNNYVSVVNPTSNSKIQTMQENSSKLKNNNENHEMKLTKMDFPALFSKPIENLQTNWGKTKVQESRKSKIAPTPILQKKIESIKKRETDNCNGEDNNNSKQFPNKSDNEDMVFSPEINNLSAMISAKHRQLVDNNYVSVVNPTSNSKIQTMQENSSKLKNNNENHEMKLTKMDFPALFSKPIENLQTNWGKTKVQESRKSKIAPTPILPKKIESIKKRETDNCNGEDNNNNKKKNNKNNEFKKGNDPKTGKNPDKKNSESYLKKSYNNDNSKLNERNNTDVKIVNGIVNHSNLSNQSLKNLANNTEKLKLIKPPPGFNSITLNSVGKPQNALTFTTSLGESYNIIPDNVYTAPPNADARNRELPFHFQQALPTPEAFNKFRKVSSQFRQGSYNAPAYFEECRMALKDRFDDIFPELLALLPDISKQQDLYLEYQQYLKKKSKSLNPHQKLEMCYICKQIVKSFDVDSHVNSHQLHTNFPKL